MSDEDHKSSDPSDDSSGPVGDAEVATDPDDSSESTDDASSLLDRLKSRRSRNSDDKPSLSNRLRGLSARSSAVDSDETDDGEDTLSSPLSDRLPAPSALSEPDSGFADSADSADDDAPDESESTGERHIEEHDVDEHDVQEDDVEHQDLDDSELSKSHDELMAADSTSLEDTDKIDVGDTADLDIGSDAEFAAPDSAVSDGSKTDIVAPSEQLAEAIDSAGEQLEDTDNLELTSDSDTPPSIDETEHTAPLSGESVESQAVDSPEAASAQSPEDDAYEVPTDVLSESELPFDVVDPEEPPAGGDSSGSPPPSPFAEQDTSPMDRTDSGPAIIDPAAETSPNESPESASDFPPPENTSVEVPQPPSSTSVHRDASERPGPALETDGAEPGLVESTKPGAPPAARPNTPDSPPGKHHGEAPSPGDITAPEADAAAASPGVDPADDSPADDAEAPGGNFDAEDTELYTSPYDNDPICPRLRILDGPAAGRDFLVNQNRNTVGRGSDNSMVVSDDAMSRKHFEILQHADESHTIRDLMAANGTELNGTSIKEADLFHGDRIEAGTSTFQFLIPGNAPVKDRNRDLVPAQIKDTISGETGDEPDDDHVPAEQPGRFDHVLVAITAVAGLASIPLAAFLLYATFIADPLHDEPTAYELYDRGIEAYQTGQWDQAEALFEESQRLDPDFGLPERQFERIEKERAAQKTIEDARRQVDDGLDDDLLRQLRSISPERRHYYEEAQSLLTLARQHEANDLLEQARRAFDDGDYEETARRLSELEAVSPEHEAADDLAQRLAEATEGDDETDDSGVQQPTDSPPPSRPPPTDDDSPSPTLDVDDPFVTTGADDAPPDDGPSVRINFTDGFTMYRNRQFDDAIDHFDAIADASTGAISRRAEDTAQQIRTFQQKMDRGRQARELGDFDEAVDSLRNARRADQRVVGQGGAFEAMIADEIAASFAERGLRQLEDNRPTAAFDSLERARAYAEDAPQTGTLRERITDRADDMLREADDIKHTDPDRSAELCRAILSMLPSSHDTAARARALLDDIE